MYHTYITCHSLDATIFPLPRLPHKTRLEEPPLGLGWCLKVVESQELSFFMLHKTAAAEGKIRVETCPQRLESLIFKKSLRKLGTQGQKDTYRRT